MQKMEKPGHDFGILRELRMKRGWTLEYLAKASNLSYPTVASIETNKTSPSLKTIDALADALGIPAGKLISLASRHRAKINKTSPIHAKVLKRSGINLKNINVTSYQELKIFRARVDGNQVVQAMKLHDDCDCSELCFCLEGLLEITVKGEKFRLSTNEVILFDGTVKHEYKALHDSEYLVIHIPNEKLSNSLLENTLS
jgi:transcriptional regulator with XRE-family HTH domain